MATLPVPTGGREPSLSPDMSQLAYTAPGAGAASSVVILDLGGGPSRTLEAQGAQPTWLPDGHIGARGGDQMSGTTLTRQRADGSEREVLVDTGGAGISYMEWSPDGSRVAFSLTLPSGATRIDVVKADGTEGRALIDVRGGAAIRPRWSPDGKRVAALVRQPADAKLVAPNTIYVADPATGESLPLFEVKAEEPSVLGRGAYKGARELVWSPDSRSIGFFAAMEGDCNQNTSGELLCRNDLYVVKADGGVPRKVFSARLPEPRQLAWLP